MLHRFCNNEGKIRSGTVIALLFISVILAGGIIAERPRFTVPAKVRKLARELPRRLREKYPDAKIIVRTKACTFKHTADLEIYFDRRNANITLEKQRQEIEAWLAREFPGAFLQTIYIRVALGAREFHRNHDGRLSPD